ncbi:MAG: tRNA (adenosine(37)-N6)-threonylcarbamoyltransferase complex ATPase subunit type 1 TsaE [Candidatus Gygaella obscura]|nr:tRNA (adenosine(37)-N6)-threonylcarbamoyltransferase complex ATPase subunit type 1 TsaE [Candidatus Gygaella obscura]
MRIISNSSSETIQIAKRLTKYLVKGDSLALVGPLGCGKTVFAKGIASGFGFNQDKVTSSSFVLMQRYKTKKVDIYHLDLYRINSKNDLYGIGYDEVFSSGGLIIIEWPSIIKGFLPKGYVEIRFKILSSNKRLLDINTTNIRIKRMLGKINKT